MAVQMVPGIKADRIGSKKPFHSVAQIGLWSFYDQMKMITHQTVGVYLPVTLRAYFSKSLDPKLAIRVAMDNCFAMIPAAHHVIDRTGIFDSDLAGHGRLLNVSALLCQS